MATPGGGLAARAPGASNSSSAVAAAAMEGPVPPPAERLARTQRRAPGLQADLREDALEPRLAARVHVRHGVGNRWVARRDLGVHLLRDGAVAGVALAAGAQLDQVHRLARVEVEHVADAVAEAEGVG